MEHVSELATAAAESTLSAADKAAYHTVNFAHGAFLTLEPYGIWIVLAAIAWVVVGAIAMGTIVAIVILAMRGDIKLMRPRDEVTMEEVLRDAPTQED